MPDSKRFRQLIARLNEIRKHFIPPTRVAGNYTPRQRDDLRAYRLLVHAEIEAYLEDSVISVLNKALSKFGATMKLSKPLIAAFTYSELQSQGCPKQLGTSHEDCRQRTFKTVNTLIIRAQRQNHGIKEENLLALLLPAGIDPSQIDPTLVNTLNSYGTGRGSIAHTSARTQQAMDPVTEVNNVALIVTELRKLDQVFRKLLKN